MAIQLILVCKEGPARSAYLREAMSIGIEGGKSMAIPGIGIRIKQLTRGQKTSLEEKYSI
jgi:hypothetical protein